MPLDFWVKQGEIWEFDLVNNQLWKLKDFYLDCAYEKEETNPTIFKGKSINNNSQQTNTDLDSLKNFETNFNQCRKVQLFKNKICVYYGYGENMFIYDMDLILRMKVCDIKNEILHKDLGDSFSYSKLLFLTKTLLIGYVGS